MKWLGMAWNREMAQFWLTSTAGKEGGNHGGERVVRKLRKGH